MRNLISSKIPVLFLFVSALIAFGSLSALAQGKKSVKVTFQAGIYRDWDKSWMTTAPQDVVATLTSSKGASTKSPVNDRGMVTFDSVPCGEQVKINIKFVGTASYASNSRNYTKAIPCGKTVVNLGKLEYGKW